MEQDQPQQQAEEENAPRAQAQHSGLTLPPDNPDRTRLFRLSDEERQRAMQLKSDVESSEDIENLPDLQYVQFALAFGGDLEVTLERMRRLQAFRHEYRIVDTFEEGMAITRAFSRDHPGFFLSFAYDDETENYGLIYDRSRVNHEVLQTNEHWRTLLGCAYFIFNTLVPDPHSMRQGIFLIAECEGMLSERMRPEALLQCWHHLLEHLPIHYQSMKWFHTNLVANVVFALLKPFMRSNVKDRITLGCQFGCNLSSLYLLPTPEIATERALQRLADFMRRRYENQATFSLS